MKNDDNTPITDVQIEAAAWALLVKEWPGNVAVAIQQVIDALDLVAHSAR